MSELLARLEISGDGSGAANAAKQAGDAVQGLRKNTAEATSAAAQMAEQIRQTEAQLISMAGVQQRVAGETRATTASFADFYDQGQKDFFAIYNAGAKEFIKTSGQGANAVGLLNGATKLTNIQMMELAHVARATADGLAVGISPARMLAMEGARVAQALGSGPGGVMGSLKALGAMALPFAAWLAPLALVGGGIALWIHQMHAAKEEAAQLKKDLTALGETQRASTSAMEHAIEFSNRYHVSSDALWNSLEHVISSQGMVNNVVRMGVGATDEAARAARDRAEAERILTVAMLRKTAAEAQQRASDAAKDLKGFERTAAISGMFAGFGMADSPDALAVAQQGRDEALKKHGADKLKDAISQEQALAKALLEQADAVAKAKLTVDVKASSRDREADRAPNALIDLKERREAQEALTAALRQGGVAMDEWRIKDAGRQAVEKSGLSHKATLTAAEQALAEKIRGNAEATERLKLANERVEKAVGLQRTAGLDTKALEARAVAAAQGEAALEALRVKEAGLQAMRQIGIETLDQLTGADRAEAAAAIAAAEAKERQAIATEKSQRVAATLQDLGDQIDAEKARTIAVMGGVKAEVEYARTMAIRQAILRTGRTLTEEETRAISDQVDVLFRLRAANDAADFTTREADELRLLTLTNREREIEIRYLRIRKEYLAEGQRLLAQELDARARAQALAEQAAADDARAIGELKEGLKKAFVESGHLGFDDVGKYAERKLREAIYNAFLARPIDIIVNAVVGSVTGLGAAGGAANALGQAGAAGGGLGGLGGLMGLPASLAAASGNLNVAASQFLLAHGAPTWAINVGGQVAGASPYAIVGNLLSSALGIKGYQNGMVQGIGDAVASTIGMSVGGPIGAIVATIGAHLLGGLFNKDPSNHSASAVFSGDSFSVVGNKQIPETAQAATAAANAYLQGVQILQAAGITLTTTVRDIDLGTRDQTHIHLSDGRDVRTAVGDPAAAAEAALRAVLEGATYVSDAQKHLVDSMLAAGKGFDDVAAALQGYAAAQELQKQIEHAILQYTDPLGAAKVELEAAQKARREQIKAAADAGYLTAEQLDVINQQLAQLEGLELNDVLKRFGAAVDEAAAAAQRQADAASLRGSIEDQILQLTNPNAFRLKQIEDEIAAERAKALPLIASGDLSATILDQLEQLRQLKIADAFRDVADAAQLAAKAFQAARPRLLDWLDQVAMGPSAELSPEAQRQAALDAYKRQLSLAQGGDASALSNITAYADRLFSADRNATASAQDRLALYNQVTGEISALAARGAAGGSDAAIAGMSDGMLALVETAKQQLAMAKAAQEAGGSPVLIANLPSLKVVYGQALEDQTAKLVAANDKVRTELGAKLDDVVKALAAVKDVTAGGLAAVASGLDDVAGGIDDVHAAAADQATELRLTGAYMRQAVAR